MSTAEPDTPVAQLCVPGNSSSPISSIALSRSVLAWLASTGSGTAPNAEYERIGGRDGDSPRPRISPGPTAGLLLARASCD